MMKIAKWGAGLIALYLVVEHYTGAGSLLSNGSSGGATVIKALQGR
jgi:hypothetical protein